MPRTTTTTFLPKYLNHYCKKGQPFRANRLTIISRILVLLLTVAQPQFRTGKTKPPAAACFGHCFYVFLDNRICEIKNKHLTLYTEKQSHTSAQTTFYKPNKTKKP